MDKSWDDSDLTIDDLLDREHGTFSELGQQALMGCAVALESFEKWEVDQMIWIVGGSRVLNTPTGW